MAEFKCEMCGKEFDSEKALRMHKLGARHSNEQPAAPQPESQPQPQQPQQPQPSPQPDLPEQLKALGIEPDQIMAILSPLVEKAVVQTLEKMQLGEAINKKISDVEAKLGNQIRQTLEPLQQAATSQSSGNGNNPPNTLGDQLVPLLIQKVLGGGGSDGGSLEQITKTLELASNVANVVMKPYMQGQQDTLRQLNELLKLSAGLGLTPEQKKELLGGFTNKGASGA